MVKQTTTELVHGAGAKDLPFHGFPRYISYLQTFENMHEKIIGNPFREQKASLPKDSMYGIFTYIWFIFMVNVGKYTIHSVFGLGKEHMAYIASGMMPAARQGRPNRPGFFPFTYERGVFLGGGLKGKPTSPQNGRIRNFGWWNFLHRFDRLSRENF